LVLYVSSAVLSPVQKGPVGMGSGGVRVVAMAFLKPVCRAQR
jgi:hypothetical protein